MQDPKPVPKVMKKKKKKIEKAKATDERLEGFVNWTNLGVSESTKEEEAEMSGLVSGFTARMRKRAASAHGETALGAGVPGEKRPKLTDLDEEAQKSLTIINMDSPDRAFDA